jgi:hypothetical protein
MDELLRALDESGYYTLGYEDIAALKGINFNGLRGIMNCPGTDTVVL